jgi:hypothetical protein
VEKPALKWRKPTYVRASNLDIGESPPWGSIAIVTHKLPTFTCSCVVYLSVVVDALNGSVIISVDL